jgi:uncharacterized protein YjbI with pentapeptide repeats
VSSALSDSGHVEILLSGPTKWNAWREENPSIIPDLSGIALKLSERQLGPINGGPINLRSARLRGAMLRFATLSAAHLGAADMSECDLVHARFDGADLQSTNLSGAQLDHADFATANLANANLCGASLTFAALTDADLEGANMSNANLAHVRLTRANLRYANLNDALLDHVDFADADLANADLRGANLSHAKNLTKQQLEEAVTDGSTTLPSQLISSISWSVKRSETGGANEQFSPRVRHWNVAKKSSYNQRAWIAGVAFIGGALVTSGLIWQHINAPEPFDASPTHRESDQSLDEQKPDVRQSASQPEGPEMTMKDPGSATHQSAPSVVELPAPAATDKMDLPENRPEPGSAPEPTASAQGANLDAHRAPDDDGSRPLEREIEPRKHALEIQDGTPPIDSPESSGSRHGTAPDALTKAPQTATAEALSAPTQGATEQSTVSPLSDSKPPITFPLPSVAIPQEAPPLPLRKPVKGEASEPPDVVRKSADFKADTVHRAKLPRLVEKKTAHRSAAGWVADLLAGGF